MGKNPHVNWEDWRTRFIQGGDDLTLKVLSEQENAPAHQTIRDRSSKEKWPELRKQYREAIVAQLSAHPEVQLVLTKVSEIIDVAQMLIQHVKIAKLVQGKSLQKIKEINPKTLTNREALEYLKYSIELERLTQGLATQHQSVDVKAMSDEQLEKVANGQS